MKPFGIFVGKRITGHLLFCVALTLSACSHSPNATAKNSAEQARDIACKLAFIFSPAALEYLSDKDSLPEKDPSLGKKIRSYISSISYASLEPSTGRKELSAAFATAKRVQADLDLGNSFEAGRLMAEGMTQIGRACMFYKMPECISFADQQDVEVNAFFSAMNTLKECGAKSWASN